MNTIDESKVHWNLALGDGGLVPVELWRAPSANDRFAAAHGRPGPREARSLVGLAQQVGQALGDVVAADPY